MTRHQKVDMAAVKKDWADQKVCKWVGIENITDSCAIHADEVAAMLRAERRRAVRVLKNEATFWLTQKAVWLAMRPRDEKKAAHANECSNFAKICTDCARAIGGK